jgi:hypothetical protein
MAQQTAVAQRLVRFGARGSISYNLEKNHLLED